MQFGNDLHVTKPVSRLLAKNILLLVIAATLAGCGVNNIPSYEESAVATWAQVENQYQRRADLVPNLVQTVKGFAAQEASVLTAVVEARARASSMQLDADLLSDPESFALFQQNQEALSGALSRLLVTVEAYPDLKSNQNFLALQSQLEGTENRISVARRDYIDAVRRYNTELKTIPGRWWASFLYPEAKPMATFSSTPETSTPPNVSFE